MFLYCVQAVPMRVRAGLGSAAMHRPAGNRSSELGGGAVIPLMHRYPGKRQSPDLAESNGGTLVPAEVVPRRTAISMGSLGSAASREPRITIWGHAVLERLQFQLLNRRIHGSNAA